MIICPAQPFDIFSIMNIERQSFIPAIQEKKRTFEKRLKIFPEGFLVLADCSEEVIKKNKSALVCGYLCGELWDFLPEKAQLDLDSSNLSEKELKSKKKEAKSQEKKLEKRFSLGHNPLYTHKSNGSYLYFSSFALLKNYRGRGIGEKFFLNSLAALSSAFSQVKSIVILVDQEWENALKIYKKLGFSEKYRLEKFFPTIQKKEFADGLVMTCDAARFREISFTENGNDLSGIRI